MGLDNNTLRLTELFEPFKVGNMDSYIDNNHLSNRIIESLPLRNIS